MIGPGMGHRVEVKQAPAMQRGASPAPNSMTVDEIAPRRSWETFPLDFRRDLVIEE
jgi:hypothetical protein